MSRLLYHCGIEHNVLNAKYHAEEARIISEAGHFGAVTIATNMAGRGTDIKPDESAKKAGGLIVIGTSRSSSKRIDDQLIGRSGRQGDPGESVFYLSLEDELFKLYGDEKISRRLKGKAAAISGLIDSSLARKFIKKAQNNAEGTEYMIRKEVFEYDKILDKQRSLIYTERERILNANSL